MDNLNKVNPSMSQEDLALCYVAMWKHTEVLINHTITALSKRFPVKMQVFFKGWSGSKDHGNMLTLSALTFLSM